MLNPFGKNLRRALRPGTCNDFARLSWFGFTADIRPRRRKAILLQGGTVDRGSSQPIHH